MNVLIVDDEAMIREWLTFTMNNLPMDLDRIDAASDGQEALEMLSETTYDLVLVDINMPKMNGIDLIKAMNQLASLPMIVVLSSHEQFNYVREALQYNAKEYVLKSECSKEKLQTLLEECQLEIQKKSHKTDLSYDRSSFLNSVLFGKPLLSHSGMGNLFPDLDEKAYFVITFDRNKVSANGPGNISREENMLFIGNSKRISFFICHSEKAMSPTVKNTLLSKYSDELSTQLGASGDYNDLKSLPSAIHIAHHALEQLFYSDDTFSIGSETQDQRLSEEHDQLNKQCALVLSSIKSNDLDQARDNLSVLHHLTLKYKPLDISSTKNIHYSILSALLIHLSRNTHQVIPNLEDLKSKIESCVHFGDIKAYTDEYFYFLSPQDKPVNDISSNYILEAINFIHTKYASIESISQIANRVHINTDYFSRLFKKEVGLPASTYLMNYKLEIAADALRTTEKTINEIAFSVGYQNISYFSKIFKAKYGLQPSQYRKGK